MIRIINHKKLDLTNDEFSMYEAICRSYDDIKANRKGEDLFVDHFEVNKYGIIMFVRPPNKRYTSLEVYCFLISIMHNQHIRIMHEQTNALVKEASDKISDLMKQVQNLISSRVAE